MKLEDIDKIHDHVEDWVQSESNEKEFEKDTENKEESKEPPYWIVSDGSRTYIVRNNMMTRIEVG